MTVNQGIDVRLVAIGALLGAAALAALAAPAAANTVVDAKVSVAGVEAAMGVSAIGERWSLPGRPNCNPALGGSCVWTKDTKRQMHQISFIKSGQNITNLQHCKSVREVDATRNRDRILAIYRKQFAKYGVPEVSGDFISKSLTWGGAGSSTLTVNIGEGDGYVVQGAPYVVCISWDR